MSAKHIYIFDTVKSSTYGKKYQDIISKATKASPDTFYIDNPDNKDTKSENESAKQIRDCNYFLLLEKNDSKKYDQVIFAENAGKKIFKIDVNYFHEHARIKSVSLSEFLYKLALKNQYSSEIKCPACNTEADPVYEYCPTCGHKFSENDLIKLKSELEKNHYNLAQSSTSEKRVHQNSNIENYESVPDNYKEVSSTTSTAANNDRGENEGLQILPVIFLFILAVVTLFYGKIVLGKDFIYIMLCIITEICIVFGGLLVYTNINEKNTELEKNISTKIHNNTPDKRQHVFISYSHESPLLHKDSGFKELTRQLNNNKISCWYDHELHNHAGLNYNDEIAEHIRKCPTFLCLIDKFYTQSTYCQDEFYYAKKLKKKVLPVLLEDIELPPGMDMRLSKDHEIIYSKYNSNIAAFYADIINNVNKDPK